jgi:hypothetical protein
MPWRNMMFHVQGDDETMVAAASDNHIRVDFLKGHMPAVSDLHLQHHPYAPRTHVEVPMVTRWRHPKLALPDVPEPDDGASN